MLNKYRAASTLLHSINQLFKKSFKYIYVWVTFSAPGCKRHASVINLS